MTAIVAVQNGVLVDAPRLIKDGEKRKEGLERKNTKPSKGPKKRKYEQRLRPSKQQSVLYNKSDKQRKHAWLTRLAKSKSLK